MITLENYFQKIAGIDFDSFPAELRKDLRDGDLFLRRVTGNGGDPAGAEASAQIRRTVESYLALLNKVSGEPVQTTEPAAEIRTAEPEPEKPCPCPEPVPIVPAMPEPLFLGEAPKRKGRTGTPPKKRRKPSARPGRKKKPFKFERGFFEAYVGLDGKKKSKAQIGELIDRIQEAIHGGKVRKRNPFGKDVMFMQNKLIALHNDMKKGERREIKVNTRVVRDFKEVISWDGRIAGEILLENFLALIGKPQSGTAIMHLCFDFEVGLKNGRIQGQYKAVSKSVLAVLKKPRRMTRKY